MNRWKNRVALVTGASSGIGRAIAIELAKQGMIVVGVARRVDKLKDLKNLLEQYKFHYRQCDVTEENQVVETINWIEETTGRGIDVLINNAGLGRLNTMLDGKTEDWKLIMKVNVIGVSICAREAVKSMRRHQIDDGHIVYISSLAAHRFGCLIGSSPMYRASKHGVRAIADCLRKELVAEKSKIRVTCVSPSYTRSEIFEGSGRTIPEEPILEPEDIGDIVVNVLKVPPSVQISEVIVHPVGSCY
ncbi:farnesol dehydrogenase-like [Daktulosphaira vitifoliae]|uniref:farnesol dehydrogenase-like n=1 Tax=Daktulosphaira vitifoliae TaxID=58002 RepID=UPI0021AA1D53|nr:farnesol dehydrogenase-like [Daktulosphaira vitifoliae]